MYCPLLAGFNSAFKAECFAGRRQAFCPAPIVRRKAPVLLPAVGGFPFGRKPKVLLASSLFGRKAPVILPGSMLAVGELFVWARSARSQARSACVIARRRRALPPRGTKTSTPAPESSLPAAGASEAPVLLPAVGERYLLVGPRQAPRHVLGCHEPFGEAESSPPAALSHTHTFCKTSFNIILGQIENTIKRSKSRPSCS